VDGLFAELVSPTVHLWPVVLLSEMLFIAQSFISVYFITNVQRHLY